MGQYYKPTNIDKLESLCAHSFDNGLKLMEHSYIDNNFVKAVERLLSPKGPWHKCRFCWAGDYMDAGLFLPEGTPLKTEEGYDVNLYTFVGEKSPFVSNLKEWLKSLPYRGRYLVNHTKRVCIDLRAENVDHGKNQYGYQIWAIHPLPLLTCSGNGRGGGDYHGSKMNIVGAWAGDVISIERKPMFTLNPPIIFMEGEEESGTYVFVSNACDEPKEAKTKKRRAAQNAVQKEKWAEEKARFEKSDMAELLG